MGIGSYKIQAKVLKFFAAFEVVASKNHSFGESVGKIAALSATMPH